MRKIGWLVAASMIAMLGGTLVVAPAVAAADGPAAGPPNVRSLPVFPAGGVTVAPGSSRTFRSADGTMTITIGAGRPTAVGTRSVGTGAAAGRRQSAAFTVYYEHSSVYECSILSCWAWHAQIDTWFYYTDPPGYAAEAWHNIWGYGGAVDCNNNGGTGYSVDVNLCQWSPTETNPAITLAHWLQANEEFHVNVLSGIGGSYYHTLHIEDFGNGSVRGYGS